MTAGSYQRSSRRRSPARGRIWLCAGKGETPAPVGRTYPIWVHCVPGWLSARFKLYRTPVLVLVNAEYPPAHPGSGPWWESPRGMGAREGARPVGATVSYGAMYR
ncbi:protein of unknown function [Methanoculleus bourgensis]|uniref:Uncharacterized protein n=1 Tax=Methanoculleus bourgensis TaxID=83986 RepID=A0A0X3BJN4_9EURY|nr:protein of unknown function [Methanoculleus bourgensis]